MNIQDILRDSYKKALKALVMGTSPESLARARERAFVKTLATQLESAYEGEESRVFSAYGRGNRPDFGSEQLLFDIEVCRVATANSAHRKQESFYYITEALWQIEIELSQDWRQVVFAMNRLCCGAAANKLIVAAQSADANDIFLETLEPGAASCGGNVFLATISHPRNWEDEEEPLKVWQIADSKWQAVS